MTKLVKKKKTKKKTAIDFVQMALRLLFTIQPPHFFDLLELKSKEQKHLIELNVTEHEVKNKCNFILKSTLL